MKKFILLLILIFVSSAVYSAPEKKIYWNRVPGAWGYTLEIKDSSDKVIVDIQQRGNSYSVSQLEPGEYSFRIAALNMLRQKGESTGWVKFSIEKLYIPQLKSVSKKQLISGYKNKGIYVYGKNIRPESRFILRGNEKELEITDKRIISGTEAVLSFRPESSTKGIYDLVIINRGDVESVLKNGIEIIESTEAERKLAFGAGYRGSYPLGAWTDYIAPEYIGGKVYFQVYFKTPILEHFFIDMESDAAKYKNKAGTNIVSMFYGSFGLGGGYYYPFTSTDIELFIKANGGAIYTVINFDKKIAKNKMTSADYFASASTGVRFYIGDIFFIEPALSWKTAFYKGAYLHEAAGVLCTGVKF